MGDVLERATPNQLLHLSFLAESVQLPTPSMRACLAMPDVKSI
jgi:hypothetical protein